MRRRLVWPAVLPLAAAGVLAGHELAYRLTGGGGAGLHDYLAHAPQLLVALSVPALLVALSGGRTRPPRPLGFALLGVGGFAAMEHLERLGAGGLPWLLTSPTFLLGLALQLPFALAAWWLARTLLALDAPPRRRASVPRFTFAVPVCPTRGAALAVAARPRPRGPPPLPLVT